MIRKVTILLMLFSLSLSFLFAQQAQKDSVLSFSLKQAQDFALQNSPLVKNANLDLENAKNMIPSARYQGEFTFDRLQFALNGRTGGTLKIDDIRVGRKLEEVIY